MATTAYTIDPAHTGIHFVARHMVITKVRGSFRKFEGTLALDEEDFTRSRVSVTIDAASIHTGEERRDAHLRSADFFDAERFPALTFESRSIEARGKDEYAVKGTLTIHGVSKDVVLDTTYEGRGKDPWGNEKIAFSARTSVNREDFGLTWNQVLEAGGLLVSSKIDIELDVQAVRAKG